GWVDAIAADSPFAVVGSAIRRAAGIIHGEPAPACCAKLRARLGRHLAPDKLDRVAPFLGEVAGVAFPDAESEPLRTARADPRLMGDSMLMAWLDWLEAECAAQPVLLLLEDLRYADRSSMQYVDAALRT